eukprot:c7290_g1_i2.p1 GENE.c7290_g1_i2~~c7290_g1_i2.p1  ORF type:complete len:717 (+),score=121.33 c7290_g1_i2:350-2500(+)
MGLWWIYMNHIHFLLRRGNEHLCGGSVYADLPFHLNLATSFIYGCNKDATITSSLLSLFFAGEALAYPFMPDFYVGALTAAGFSLRYALVVPGSILLTAMFALLYHFTYRFTQSSLCGLLSIPLTLFAGGIGGYYYIQKQPDWWTWSVLTSTEFTHGPDHVLYWVDRRSAFWFSLPAHILFPQRTVHHAYPLAITVFLLIWTALEAKVESAKLKSNDDVDNALHTKVTLYTTQQSLALFAFAGFVTALIPLMQPHSFISVGIVILVVAILQTIEILIGKPSRQVFGLHVLRWATYGLVSFALGLPQFFKYFFHRVTFGSGSRGTAFVRYNPAWIEEGKGESPATMWFRALGLMVPIFLFSMFLLPSKLHRYFHAGLTVLFVVCSVIMFQPWHLDNTKLFYVWVFGATACVAWAISSALRAINRIPFILRIPLRVLVGAVFISLIFSGALACWREMLNNAKTYDDTDFDFANWLVENTPADAIFMGDITKSSHISVESSLAGRQIAVGFPGWLSSHGISSHSRKQSLMHVMKGNIQGISSLREQNISYVVVEGWAHDKFDLEFLHEISDPVATNGKFTVFKVLDEIRNGGFKITACPEGGQNKKSCWSAGCLYFPNAAQSQQCIRKPRERQVADCHVSSAAECRQNGCLWYEGFAGPWCHQPRWQVAGEQGPEKIKQLTPPIPGSDCGWENMNERSCVARGCLWRPAPPYMPWCVFP